MAGGDQRTDLGAGPVGVAGAGPALFRLVRFWSRRWSFRAVEQLTGDQRLVQDVLVLEAVDSAARSRPQVSVADVAGQLGIDRSRGSRLVADAVERGYLSKAAAAWDVRRAAVTVTPAGRHLLACAHVGQEQVYAQLTVGWELDDALQLAGCLRRLAEEQLDTQPHSSGATHPDTRLTTDRKPSG